MKAYKERASLRGLERVFHVSRTTVLSWLRERAQQLPTLQETLLPVQGDDVLELDEMWSFVFKKDNKRWIWTAISRKTRQIVAFVIGDRSEKTCRRLWQRLPAEYRELHSFSDFWEAYKKVFPKETHRCVGKETGETAHMERWYNTLRQRLARFVRKTLSVFPSPRLIITSCSSGLSQSTTLNDAVLSHHLLLDHYRTVLNRECCPYPQIDTVPPVLSKVQKKAPSTFPAEMNHPSQASRHTIVAHQPARGSGIGATIRNSPPA